MKIPLQQFKANDKFHWKKKSGFVDSGFVKTCDELVIGTTLIGNPELRFQPNEGVQKSIINNIRYTADRGTKEAYQNVLGKNICRHN